MYLAQSHSFDINELTIAEGETTNRPLTNQVSAENTTETIGSATETIGDKARFINKIGDKLATNKDIGDKLAINEELVDKLADIMVFLKQHPRSKSADVAEVMGMGTSNVRNYLNCLVLLDLVATDGTNKNRVYSITELL